MYKKAKSTSGNWGPVVLREKLTNMSICYVSVPVWLYFPPPVHQMPSGFSACLKLHWVGRTDKRLQIVFRGSLEKLLLSTFTLIGAETQSSSCVSVQFMLYAALMWSPPYSTVFILSGCVYSVWYFIWMVNNALHGCIVDYYLAHGWFSAFFVFVIIFSSAPALLSVSLALPCSPSSPSPSSPSLSCHLFLVVSLVQFVFKSWFSIQSRCSLCCVGLC